MYGITLKKVKVGPPILNSFEESEFSQSVSWFKDRKQSEDNGNVQICLSKYNTGNSFGWICHFNFTHLKSMRSML